jgi:hypothetical protein
VRNFTPKKMTISVTVLSLASAHRDEFALAPTPNSAETSYIQQTIEESGVPPIHDLIGAGPLKILSGYRGWLLYCEGGVSIHRIAPKSQGGHGYAGGAIPGTEEDVELKSEAMGTFKARVRFD